MSVLNGLYGQTSKRLLNCYSITQGMHLFKWAGHTPAYQNDGCICDIVHGSTPFHARMSDWEKRLGVVFTCKCTPPCA